MAGIILAYVWRFHILAPGMEALRISAILTASSWAFLAFAPRWPHLSRGLRLPFVWLYLLVLVWALVGYSFGIDPEGSFSQLKDVHLRNMLFMLFLLGTISTYVRLEVAMMANAFGASVLAFYYIKGGTPTMWTPVSTYDRNDMALLFNMCLPIALWLLVEQKSRWAKFGFGLLAASLGYSVLMSQSRGGFLGLAAILLYFMVTEKTIPVRYRLGPVAILAVGLYFLPAEVKERLNTLTSLEEDYNVESATGRVEIWKRGLGYVRDRPLFGVGLDNFSEAEATLSDESRIYAGRWKASVAHNSYLEITVETGYPGGLMYLGMVATLLAWLVKWRMRLKRWRSRGGERLHALYRLANCMTASTIGFALGSFFLSTFSLSLLVMLVTLSAATIVISSRALRDVQRPGRRPGSGDPRRVRRRKAASAPTRKQVILHAG